MDKKQLYLLLILISFFTLESIAQNFRIEHPVVRRSTVDYVYIKAITITPTETKIDFITCFTGHYIYLSSPYNRNSMYIRYGNMTYSLKRTIGISNHDHGTICDPNKVLEFSAIFYPFIDYKEGEEFDLIEGEDGSWNFYGISLNKTLASDISLVYERAYWRGKLNWEAYQSKSSVTPNTFPKKNTTRKKLKKDPNFKIE